MSCNGSKNHVPGHVHTDLSCIFIHVIYTQNQCRGGRIRNTEIIYENEPKESNSDIVNEMDHNCSVC